MPNWWVLVILDILVGAILVILVGVILDILVGAILVLAILGILVDVILVILVDVILDMLEGAILLGAIHTSGCSPPPSPPFSFLPPYWERPAGDQASSQVRSASIIDHPTTTTRPTLITH